MLVCLAVVILTGVGLLLSQYLIKKVFSQENIDKTKLFIANILHKSNNPKVEPIVNEPSLEDPKLVEGKSQQSDFDDFEERFFAKINMEKTMYRDGSGEVIPSSSRELNPREKFYKTSAFELTTRMHARPTSGREKKHIDISSFDLLSYEVPTKSPLKPREPLMTMGERLKLKLLEKVK